MPVTDRASLLRTAQRKKLIIKFARPFEPGTFTGYVLGVGPKFFLFASLSDGFEFEQYSCLRISDVRQLELPAKQAAFYTAVRKIRNDEMPPKIKVNLTDASSILHSTHHSLLTIYREQIDPGVCSIGKIMSFDKTYLKFLEIDPDAEWDSAPSYYRLNQITRIDLPGPYEKALLLIGGEPLLPSGE